MKTVAIGIIGYGTVGQGVCEVLEKNAREIQRRCGYQLTVRKVAKRSWAGIDVAALPFATTTNAEEIVNDPSIDVVIELMGGYDPAYALIEQALKNGKHVITANKALIATRGQALFELARQNNLELAYEAAVAGGIPIIKVLREGMSGNEVTAVAGIINGTGNFILSAMSEEGRDFADVLKEAQALGYAEADPAFDINGTDAAHKITILAAIAFGIPLQFDRVYMEGIERITPQDIANAAELGYVIKHLGLAVRREKGVEIRVHPTLIPKDAVLASVSGVMNAVQVRGNAIGNSLYYGPGAGRLPTASAVVADLIDVVRELDLDPEDRLAEFGFEQLHSVESLPVLDVQEFMSAFYVHLNVDDSVGVLAKVTEIFARHGISIESLVQKNALRRKDIVPLIVLTAPVEGRYIRRAVKELAELACVHGEIKLIHVESLA